MPVRRRDLLCGETVNDVRGDRGELRFRAASADDESLCDRGEPSNVKDDDVGCLLIFG